MLRTMLLMALEGESEGEDVTKDEGGELGTARSISETSSTGPCLTFVGSYMLVVQYSFSFK